MNTLLLTVAWDRVVAADLVVGYDPDGYPLAVDYSPSEEDAPLLLPKPARWVDGHGGGWSKFGGTLRYVDPMRVSLLPPSIDPWWVLRVTALRAEARYGTLLADLGARRLADGNYEYDADGEKVECLLDRLHDWRTALYLIDKRQFPWDCDAAELLRQVRPDDARGLVLESAA